MSRALRQRRLRQRRTTLRRTQLLIAAVVFIVLGTAGGAWAAYDYLKGGDAKWPSIETLQPQRIGQNSEIFSADGTSMGFIKSDQHRTNLKYPQMGEWTPKATVAIEDRRFYTHNGVDPEGMVRALTVNLESGQSKEGASTITQQVVRNLYKEITAEKTLSRKAKEATLAVQLENRWSKEKILETYLNLVFYGNNAYGIEAASLTYFDKPADKLTIPEAALIAGLPQSPSVYDPFRNKKDSLTRRNEVLDAMYGQKMITADEHDAATKSPIKLHPSTQYSTHKLPYFFDYVEKDLISQFGAAAVREGGLRIKTTIDPKLQTFAESAIRDTIAGTGKSAAIAVLDTRNGQIKAMASSSSYAKSKFSFASQAHRQPGSTAKIWVLTAFVKEGIDPDATNYVSRPFSVRYKGSGEAGWWKPKTFGGEYAGSRSIRSATLASDNSVYAQMTLDISPEKVAAAAHQLGITSKLDNVWSIGLGSQEVTPLEQTNFYSSIARGGQRIDPRAVSSVTTAGGTKLPLNYKPGHKVLEDWQAGKIVDILRNNVTGGTGRNASIPGAEVAGKTGTTDDAKDAWFCGMTPELTACVWLGYETPAPMYGEQGGNTPARIWRRFMEPALQQVKNQDWFIPKLAPAWVPGWDAGKWTKNPSFDTAVGANPSARPKATDPKDQEAAANAKADADATKGADVGGAPVPGAGTGTAPVTPAPTPATPTPPAPAPAPVAKH
ncbi:MAG: PBP1A family penicillin-binding protein [Thermoleophilia bacterium]|nr:PBP1A family penicillin-binding protein [Thermoleophilia bacterium]